MEAVRRLNGKDFIVDLPVRDLTDEDMLRIMSNENVAHAAPRTEAQIDTILAVKKFLETGVQTVDTRDKTGRGGDHRSKEAGPVQISHFLGDTNWSKTKVADLFKLDFGLTDDI